MRHTFDQQESWAQPSWIDRRAAPLHCAGRFDPQESWAQPMTRVLFVSDVYFPRVNGVSTSIRTFRQDLSACGVDTLLVVPSYDESATSDERAGDEPGILRVASSRVPKDPEDRRMRWGPLNRALASIPRGHVDLVHIHTPFVA